MSLHGLQGSNAGISDGRHRLHRIGGARRAAARRPSGDGARSRSGEGRASGRARRDADRRRDWARPSVSASALAGADAVIHTAFERSPRGIEKDREALETMLASLTRARPPAASAGPFIYTSGVWVLGNTTRPADEDSADRSAPPTSAGGRAHEQIVLDAGNERPAHDRRPARHRLWRVARHRVRPAEGRAERADARDRTGQESLADASTIATWRICTCGCCRRPTRAASSTRTTKTDERVNDIVEAIADHLTQRPDIRHMPLPEARRKLGTYADALALDQRVRSPRARRSAGRRRCRASPPTCRGCSKNSGAAAGS